jgi:hypothetical protein
MWHLIRADTSPPDNAAAAYADLFGWHVGDPASVVTVAVRGGESVGYVPGVVEPPSLVALAGRAGWIHDPSAPTVARRRGAEAGERKRSRDRAIAWTAIVAGTSANRI